MTPQELRGSILSLAVQGKLVKQLEAEETAEPVYIHLVNEKKRLIKAGIAKQSKSLVDISEDDKLFDIPESWRWIKLGEISSVITKGTTPRGGNVSYLDSGIGFLRAENIAGLDKLDKSTLKYIDEETHNGYLKRSILETNDILITIAGTLGRTAIVYDEDLPLNANQAVSIVRIVDPKAIDLIYVVYVLNSPEIQRYLTGQRKITAIPNLTLEIIENCVIPLPPLAEQKRIVAKIEELLPYIDRYEQAWSRLEDFNKRFPVDMQKSILQMAIQGKLVEQRPEEGTGEELYQQIQAEKQKLIKEGKIKKEKPYSNNVNYQEYPFDIPASWKFVRFGELMISRDSERVPVSTSERSKRAKIYDYYGASGVIDKIDDYLFDKELLLIGEDGANLLTRSTPIAFLASGQYWVNNHAHVLDGCAGLDLKYISYYINAISLAPYVTGTAQPKMNQENMNAIWVPLPPLAEQKRIVAKLEEILPLCEKLK